MRFKGKEVIFGYRDTWFLGETFSPIILAGLKKYKEVIEDPECCAGCPGSFVLGDCTELDIEEGVKKWHDVLDKMIFSFVEHTEPLMPDGIIEFSESYLCDDGGVHSDLRIIDQEGLDNYHKELKVYNDRVQEGLDLFAKHYNDLRW